MFVSDSYVFRSPRKAFHCPRVEHVYTAPIALRSPPPPNPTRAASSLPCSQVGGCLPAWIPGSGSWVEEEVGGSVIYFCMPDLNHPLLTKWERSAIREDMQPPRLCTFQPSKKPSTRSKDAAFFQNSTPAGLENFKCSWKKASVLSILFLSSFYTEYLFTYVC